MTTVSDVMLAIKNEIQNRSELNYFRDSNINIAESNDSENFTFKMRNGNIGALITPSASPEVHEARMGKIVRITYNVEILILLVTGKKQSTRVSSRYNNIEKISRETANVLMFNNLGILRSNPDGNIGEIQVIPTENNEMSLRLLPFAGIKHERLV